MSTKEAPANGPGDVMAMRRVLNDSIAGAAERLDDDRAFFEFLCECGDSDCKGVVELTVAQYRVARFWPVVAHSSVAVQSSQQGGLAALASFVACGVGSRSLQRLRR
jgi:hypothetical protein